MATRAPGVCHGHRNDVDDADGHHGAAGSSAASSCSHGVTSSSSSLPHRLHRQQLARKSARSTCDQSASSSSAISAMGKLYIPSRKRSGGLDLSVSLNETDGLGIYSGLGARDNDDHLPAGSHHRSTSGASQLSYGSLPRPGAQYVHPMRQTPRPYTPPLGQSLQTTTNNNNSSNSATTTECELDGTRDGHELFPGSPPTSIYNEPRASVQIESETTTYSTKTRASSFGRVFNNNSPSPRDSTPLSRTSIEFGLRSKSRRASAVDPAARAIAVQAARQAFEDKEAAKLRKQDEQNLKAQDKEQRRLRRRAADDGHHAQADGGRRSLSDFTLRPSRVSEKEKHSSSYTDDTVKVSWKPKSPKSAWVLFLTWLRTRIFKIGKKLKKKG